MYEIYENLSIQEYAQYLQKFNDGQKIFVDKGYNDKNGFWIICQPGK